MRRQLPRRRLSASFRKSCHPAIIFGADTHARDNAGLLAAGDPLLIIIPFRLDRLPVLSTALDYLLQVHQRQFHPLRLFQTKMGQVNGGDGVGDFLFKGTVRLPKNCLGQQRRVRLGEQMPANGVEQRLLIVSQRRFA